MIRIKWHCLRFVYPIILVEMLTKFLWMFPVFSEDGVNVVGAGCILTFEGPSPGNGKFRTLTGVVNVDESRELECVEEEYY